MDKPAVLQQWVEDSHSIVFFGGAGVSTESGIPDFRSTDGLYSQSYAYPPETILSRSFFQRNPAEFFRFYRDKMLAPDAQPNAAHRKLAELEQAGRLSAVITQNIDGLHQKAAAGRYTNCTDPSTATPAAAVDAASPSIRSCTPPGSRPAPAAGSSNPMSCCTRSRWTNPPSRGRFGRSSRPICSSWAGPRCRFILPPACFVTIAEDAWFSSTATPPRSMKRPACSYRNRSAGCWAPCAFPQGDESLDGSRYFLCHRKGRTSTRCPPFPIAHYSDSRLRNSLTETPVCRRKRRLR